MSCALLNACPTLIQLVASATYGGSALAATKVENQIIHVLFQLALHIACSARACTLGGKEVYQPDAGPTMDDNTTYRKGDSLFDLAGSRAHPEEDLGTFIITGKGELKTEKRRKEKYTHSIPWNCSGGSTCFTEDGGEGLLSFAVLAFIVDAQANTAKRHDRKAWLLYPLFAARASITSMYVFTKDCWCRIGNVWWIYVKYVVICTCV